MLENINISVDISVFFVDVDVQIISHCPTTAESAGMYTRTVYCVQCLRHFTMVKTLHLMLV